MNDEVREAFLQDVASQVRYWTKHGIALMEPNDRENPPETHEVLQSCLTGLAHSLLVVIDGGTTMSDGGRRAWLTDEHGEPIGDGLHELLFEHL